jgi:hypothetical protein
MFYPGSEHFLISDLDPNIFSPRSKVLVFVIPVVRKIRKKFIPNPDPRGKKAAGSRIWIRNTGTFHRFF